MVLKNLRVLQFHESSSLVPRFLAVTQPISCKAKGLQVLIRSFTCFY